MWRQKNVMFMLFALFMDVQVNICTYLHVLHVVIQYMWPLWPHDMQAAVYNAIVLNKGKVDDFHLDQLLLEQVKPQGWALFVSFSYNQPPNRGHICFLLCCNVETLLLALCCPLKDTNSCKSSHWVGSLWTFFCARCAGHCYWVLAWSCNVLFLMILVMYTTI